MLHYQVHMGVTGAPPQGHHQQGAATSGRLSRGLRALLSGLVIKSKEWKGVCTGRKTSFSVT